MSSQDEMKYISRPQLIKKHLKAVGATTGFHKVNLGNMEAYCFQSVPLFVKQYNPNFKMKYFVGTVPVISTKRAPLVKSTLKEDFSDRQNRIYLNLGSLPFFDNRSGIPRVAKELCKVGIERTDVCVVPVYPDSVTGTYRVAVSWLRSHGATPTFPEWAELEKEDDPEITVKSGDWLVNTMVNSNELDFMAEQLRFFRDKGGKVGFILHDLIPEDYPNFYKSRDVKLFRRWLRNITKYDGIFAISNATKQAYLDWAERNHIEKHPRIDYFHLGADFKGKLSRQSKHKVFSIEGSFFLMVSTIEPRKGHAQVLEAFENLWKDGFEGKCVFVGRQGWKVKELILKIQRHSELGKRLFWLNRTSDEELAELYKQSSAVIIASIVEGFGLSMTEALFHQKRIIVRDIPVFRETAQNNAIYFNGNNAQDLADKIQKTYQEKDITHQEVHITSWEESFSKLIGIIKNED